MIYTYTITLFVFCQRSIPTSLCQVFIGTFFIFLYNIRFPLHFLNMQLNGHLPSKTRSRLVSTVAVLGSKTPRLPQGCAFSLVSKRLRQVFNVKYRRFQTVFSENSPSNCFSFFAREAHSLFKFYYTHHLNAFLNAVIIAPYD